MQCWPLTYHFSLHVALYTNRMASNVVHQCHLLILYVSEHPKTVPETLGGSLSCIQCARRSYSWNGSVLGAYYGIGQGAHYTVSTESLVLLLSWVIFMPNISPKMVCILTAELSKSEGSAMY